MEILFISHGVYGTNEFEKITKLALILTGKIKRVNLNDKNDTK